MPRRSIDFTWPVAERAGFIASIAAVGATFEPGMLPRGARDQAAASGVVSAINYGVVTASQTLLLQLAALAEQKRGRDVSVRTDYFAQLAGVGVGLLNWVSAGRVHESAAARALGLRFARSCAIGLVATAAGDLGGRAQGRMPGWLLPSRRPAAAAFGASVAAVAVYRRRRPAGNPPAGALPAAEQIRSMVLGGCLSAGLVGIGSVEHVLAQRVATLAEPALPAGPVGSRLAIVLGRGVVLWVTASLARAYLHGAALKSQRTNAVIGAEHREPPTLSTVSGGPASLVLYDTLSLEGARFVHRTATDTEIAAVLGHSRGSPVRAYVGLQSAATAQQRVAVALRELEALGAFDRAFLCVAVPAGTGFVNPVAVGALEYLTGGDCATVALQYSLRRSFNSVNRVGMSADQNRLLFTALTDRLQSIPTQRRPTLLLYGESLGALAAQDTFDTDGPEALDKLGVRSALFAGTPSASSWARRWRAHPTRDDPNENLVEVASYQEWSELSEQRREETRVVLLSHDDDPVTIFNRALLARPARARRVINQPGVDPVNFRPLTTFTLTAIDLKNAMNNDPLRFTTRAHDYRGDLVRFVSLAYNLPHDDATLDRVETALSQRLLAATQPD